MKIFENGYIYKITNLITNKIYIGQTTRTIDWRWKKHQRDSMCLTTKLDTKLARSIRKYGVDNFIIEEVEHLANCTQAELTSREHYWVLKLDTINNGYNIQDPIVSRGGNTYAGKSEAEMLLIRQKLSKSKLGSKNPHAKKIRCTNIETNEVIKFDSIIEAQQYFEQDNHSFISKRCRGIIKGLYQNKYKFEYLD